MVTKTLDTKQNDETNPGANTPAPDSTNQKPSEQETMNLKKLETIGKVANAAGETAKTVRAGFECTTEAFTYLGKREERKTAKINLAIKKEDIEEAKINAATTIATTTLTVNQKDAESSRHEQTVVMVSEDGLRSDISKSAVQATTPEQFALLTLLATAPRRAVDFGTPPKLTDSTTNPALLGIFSASNNASANDNTPSSSKTETATLGKK